MQLSADFVQVIQNMVTHPDWTGAVVLFWFSLLNELSGVIPYVVLVSGQLLFIEPSSFHLIIYKLFLFTAIPVGLGGAIGSLLIYGLAYFGGQPAINRFQKYLRFSWENVERINNRFLGSWYDELIYLGLRCVPFLPSLPLTVVAGIIQMSPLSYFISTFIGFTVRMMLVILFVGYSVESLAQ